MNPPERRRLVDHADPSLSIVAQCRLLKIARSTLYYRPAAVSADDLALMRKRCSATLRREVIRVAVAVPRATASIHRCVFVASRSPGV